MSEKELVHSKDVNETAARKLDEEAGLFAADVKALSRVLDEIGDFAGGDEAGAGFAKEYGKAVKQAVTFLQAISGAYPQMASRFRLMTMNVDLANWASMAALPKVPVIPSANVEK